MSSAKFSPWFPAWVKPARDGVYQVMAGTFYSRMYSEYRNGFWLGTTRNRDYASEFGRRFGHTSMHISAWRGLAKQPKEPS